MTLIIGEIFLLIYNKNKDKPNNNKTKVKG